MMTCSIKGHDIKGTYVKLANGKLICTPHYCLAPVKYVDYGDASMRQS